KRIYVPTRRSEEFLDKFGKAVDSIMVGDGLEPSVTMGPLHSQKARTRANCLVEDAARRGATVQPMARINSEPTLANGYLMRPTVVADTSDGAPLMAEDQFCPAIPVTTYDPLEEAITRANNTQFGLGASVWSRDAEKALDVARKIEARQV